MSKLLTTPEGARSEILSKRSMTTKAFNMPGGLDRYESRMGAIHYPDNGWQDIDTDIVVQGGINSIHKTWYDLQQLPTGIGFDYISKTGGRVQVALLEINDQNIGNYILNVNPRIDNKKKLDSGILNFFNVLPGFDLYFVARPLGVEIFKRIKNRSALDSINSLTWLVREFSHGIIVNTETRGFDNEENINVTSRNIKKQHYALEINNDVVQLDNYTRTVREQFTGRIWDRDYGGTRARRFYDKSSVVFPVCIDQSTFNVAADSDDGFETYSTWYNSVYPNKISITSNYGGRLPAWRWSNVTVDQGATVTLAEVTVEVVNASTDVNLTVVGCIDEDNTATFTTATRPTTRTLTSSTVSSGVVFTTAGDTTFAVTGPVQEVIQREGWANGNALAIFASTVAGTDLLTVQDYSQSQAQAGRLAITVETAITGDAGTAILDINALDPTGSGTGVATRTSVPVVIDLNVLGQTGAGTGVAPGSSGVPTVNINVQDVTGVPSGVATGESGVANVDLNVPTSTATGEGNATGDSGVVNVDLNVPGQSGTGSGNISAGTGVANIDLGVPGPTGSGTGAAPGTPGTATLQLNVNTHSGVGVGNVSIACGTAIIELNCLDVVGSAVAGLVGSVGVALLDINALAPTGLGIGVVSGQTGVANLQLNIPNQIGTGSGAAVGQAGQSQVIINVPDGIGSGSGAASVSGGPIVVELDVPQASGVGAGTASGSTGLVNINLIINDPSGSAIGLTGTVDASVLSLVVNAATGAGSGAAIGTLSAVELLLNALTVTGSLPAGFSEIIQFNLDIHSVLQFNLELKDDLQFKLDL